MAVGPPPPPITAPAAAPGAPPAWRARPREEVLGKTPRTLAAAALLSVALHGIVLEGLARYWPRAQAPAPLPAVWAITLEPRDAAPASPVEPNVNDEPTGAMQPPAPVPDSRGGLASPATADTGAAPAERRTNAGEVRLDLRLPEQAVRLPAPPMDGGEAIFDRRVRERFEQEKARPGVVNAPTAVASWVDQTGREYVLDGERCAEILPAFDHQSTAVMTLPSRCAWLKSDAERFGDALRERLRQRR